MNQKLIAAILAAIVFVLLGTTVYFVATKKTSQSISPTLDATQLPTKPISGQPVCGKLPQFRAEPWANDLNTLYKSYFLNEVGDLWFEAGTPTMAGELSSCKIKDLFIFIPEYFEFGCGLVMKYDIKNNKLNSVIGAPGSCATYFGEVTENYVEYFGEQGDGGVGRKFHGRYYFKEDRIENLK